MVRLATISIFVTLLASAAFACSGSNPAGPDANGLFALEGRVLDYATETPRAGARLSFRTSDSADPFAGVETATTAGADGKYSIRLGRGDYLVSVNGEAETSLRVPGLHRGGDIYTHPKNCSALYGYVVNRWGSPLSNVTVSAFTTKRAQTNENGWYRLDLECADHLRFNTIVVHFTRPGYEDYELWRRGHPRGAVRFDLQMHK